MKAAVVIFTDKLDEVKAFFRQCFDGVSFSEAEETFFVHWNPNFSLQYVSSSSSDAAAAKPTLRLLLPNAEIEQERIASLGVVCSDIKSDNTWGAWYAPSVRFFSLEDPSGTQFMFYSPDFGGKRQLMTTGDGTETRKVHSHD
ncbi:MAG: hypothetical protein OHK0023_15640 [Anaerolineae bacterium]